MKTKNKNKVTTKKVKTTTKKLPSELVKSKKGFSLKLENFNKDIVVTNAEKNLAIAVDNLFGLEEKIRKNIIPTIAKELYKYLQSVKKSNKVAYNELDQKALGKYVFKLVGYAREEGIGKQRKVANESFEQNVRRASKSALLIDKGFLSISKDNKLQAKSGIIYPTVAYNKGSKIDYMKNPKPNSKENVTIPQLESLFKTEVLKQTDNSKKKSPTPKDTKVKEVLIDTKIKDVKNYLLGLNSMGLEALTESNFKGSVRKELGEIAMITSLLIAKVKTITTDAKGKSTSNNNILFASKYNEQINWATTHLRNAVKNISEEPKKANTK
jgi:hypothetical protein